MVRLEDLQVGASVKGLIPHISVNIVSIQWFGADAAEVTYKSPDGRSAMNLSSVGVSPIWRSLLSAGLGRSMGMASYFDLFQRLNAFGWRTCLIRC